MTDRRARDPYDDRYGQPPDDDPGTGYGYGYADADDADDLYGEERRRRISPGVFFLVVAVVGSIAFMAYTLTVREATQIPLLAAGATVLAIVFGASAAYCLRSILRAGLERGHGGRTMLTAFVGGFAAIAAAFFAASAIIGFMASRPA
jgi:hypothetical protein